MALLIPGVPLVLSMRSGWRILQTGPKPMEEDGGVDERMSLIEGQGLLAPSLPPDMGYGRLEFSTSRG